ncbi:hypothetical protein ACFQZZ_26305 [Nocardia sp. GCM10030253]|uniref:hypothetical protein n=1 Tax=Nocardia sp. GCM10030253 TaxID=3273404 RepID=UPI003625E49E
MSGRTPLPADSKIPASCGHGGKRTGPRAVLSFESAGARPLAFRLLADIALLGE